MLADLGYLGTAAITGTRKPRGRDLTDVQRDCNSTLTGYERPWNAASPTWSTGKSSTPDGADA